MAELNKINMWQDKFVVAENNFKIKTIKTLLRQCSRWALAAEQDISPIIALLHANYAAGYLWALKDIDTDEEIKNVVEIDIIKFKKKITDIQDKCTRRVTKACPRFAGNLDKYLLQIAGDL